VPLPLAQLLVVARPHVLVPIAVLVLLAMVGDDPRPALAATVYAAVLAAGLVQTLAFASTFQNFPLAQWAATTAVSLVALAATLAATAHSVSRAAAVTGKAHDR
jgi:hypothetical protein